MMVEVQTYVPQFETDIVTIGASYQMEQLSDNCFHVERDKQVKITLKADRNDYSETFLKFIPDDDRSGATLLNNSGEHRLELPADREGLMAEYMFRLDLGMNVFTPDANGVMQQV